MTAKKNRKKPLPSKVSDSGNIFRFLSSAIASSQVSKNPILKRLLQILGNLSLNQPCWEDCGIVSHSWKIKSSGEQVELINFEDVCYLSDVLFTELDRSFEKLIKQNGETCPAFASAEESVVELAILFLRCCMKMMTLLMPKPELALEKSKTLLSLLSGLMICAMNDASLDPRCTFLCTGLEVFMNEILVDKSIRNLICLVDSVSSSCRLFGNHDMSSVVEMVSAHFIFSTSDEKMNKMCVERLSWKQVDVFKAPQVSLCAASSLLLNSAMFSTPRTIHAYVVLLVSDAIGICSTPCVDGLNFQLLDRYIDAFEKSVVLYTKHICKDENASSGKFGTSTINSPVGFDKLLLPTTLEKVNDVTLKLKDSWGAYQINNANRENDDLVACSVAYAKASLFVFDSSCSENMLSILGCVILRASSDDVMDSVLQKYNTSSMEDLYLLSSTLKLMSCSMLQAIRVLRNWNRHPSSKAVGDFGACKESKAIMDVVERFEQFSVHLSGQSFLRDKIESYPHRHVKSKWMLMHFSALLSVSFALKLDFLVKNSLFGMMVALYLFILEGGDLGALGDTPCLSENPSSSATSKDLAASGKADETAVGKKRRRVVALKFQKIRTMYLGKLSEAEKDLDSGVAVEEENCNGESFLWCVTNKRSDVEELADFVACEPGKDYMDWLKQKERFRNQQWKEKKIARQTWNKKQQAWRNNKRKNG